VTLPRASRTVDSSIEVSASRVPLIGVQLNVAEGIANGHGSRPSPRFP